MIGIEKERAYDPGLLGIATGPRIWPAEVLRLSFGGLGGMDVG